MNEKTAESLRNLCRTCMTCVNTMKRKSRTANHKQIISEKPIGCESGPTIVELLQIVQPLIKIQLDDDLPNIMCVGCIQQLQLTYEFLEMYKESNDKFQKLLKEVYVQRQGDEIVGTVQTEVEERQSDNDYKIEIEIDNMPEADPMQRDTLEIGNLYDDNENNWMEFEEEPEPTNCIEDEDKLEEERSEVFDNPYSDASDDEWKPSNETNLNKVQSVLPSETTVKRDKTQVFRSLGKEKQEAPKVKNKRKLPPKNEDGSITCQECKAVLKNGKQWREHMRDHSKVGRPRKDHKCEYCGKVLQNTATLRNHIRIHTGEEPYLCIECGKSFKVASSLNIHMLRHKGEKTFQCPNCPKKFVCSSGLYGHMMVHKKEKPFVCDICGSAFHMAYMLKKHNLYHKDIRNYPCEYCNLRFVTGEKQRRHMRTHTGEKPYRCKYCDRAFAQSNDCNKHMKQHLGENIFQCELCPLRFPLVRDLRVHFATHKDEDEETRARNLAAREVEEKNLRVKLGLVKKD